VVLTQCSHYKSKFTAYTKSFYKHNIKLVYLCGVASEKGKK